MYAIGIGTGAGTSVTSVSYSSTKIELVSFHKVLPSMQMLTPAQSTVNTITVIFHI